MAKDLLGNELKVGDKIFLNGMQMQIKEINEGGLLGATSQLSPRGVSGIIIPGTLICEVIFNFQKDQAVQTYALKQPQEAKDSVN